jgi:hypothetical protein
MLFLSAVNSGFLGIYGQENGFALIQLAGGGDLHDDYLNHRVERLRYLSVAKQQYYHKFRSLDRHPLVHHSFCGPGLSPA